MSINIKGKDLLKILRANLKDQTDSEQIKLTSKKSQKLFSVENTFDSVDFLTKTDNSSTSALKDLKSSAAPNGEIDEDVSQGATGDCWLIAAILSLNSTSAGKQTIKNSIKINSDGSVTITFKGAGKNYKITKEELQKHDTDNNKSDAYSNGDNDMLALELATEKLFKDIKSGKVKLADTDINNLIKNSSSIDDGAYTNTVQYIMTGKKTNVAKTADDYFQKKQDYHPIKLTAF